MLSRARASLTWLVLSVALPLACGGTSANFNDPEGDAGDPGTGGTTSTGGTISTGGTMSTGGTISTGGASGSSSGGLGGTISMGGTNSGGSETGGTDTGGAAGEGAIGGSGGTGALGGTGGSGGTVGGSGGVGGMPDSRCPARTPSGSCEPDGLTCRYDIGRMCLCLTWSPVGYCTEVDPRCTATAGAAPPSDEIAIPVSSQTCSCSAGTWVCRFP